jgi:hypothetical protein
MRKNNINLRILFFILLSIVMIKTNAQTGLNFQGVARTSNNVILASQAITIKLSILQGSSTGTAEYTETRKVTTNAQGLFTAVIGDTGAISTLGNFTTINWKLTPKFLKIEMDPAAGTNFITMGTTQFQYVAYAQFAKSVDAENIVGIVPVTLGGTGVNSLTDLKTALAIDKINNLADADKPISTLTQTALDLKLNATDTIKYAKQTFTDSALLTKLQVSDTTTMLSSRIARDTLILSSRINLKANTTDVTSSLSLKESISNKSTAVDLGGISPSDILFPTQKAVKDYVTANAASGSIADGGITTIKLADAAITNAKIADVDAAKITGILAITNGGTGTITTTANAIFAGPIGASGAPSFRSLIASDIPANLTGYIQNSPSATQTATIKINGTITANGIKMTTGSNNIALGIDALNNNTSGYSNSAFGISALNSNTDGYRNSAFGEYALKLNTSGYFNSAFGAESLAFNTTGWNNNAFGFRSLYQNTTGMNNAAFGNWAMFINLTGSSNNAFGMQTLNNNTTGYSNNVFGYQAMLANVDGYNNSAFGEQSLSSNTSGAANSAFGAGAMTKNTTALFNSAFGAAALYNTTTAGYNSAFGTAALYTNTTGIANAAFGNRALYATTIGSENTAFGSQSMELNTQGIGNTAIGVRSLRNNTNGAYNVAIGFGADVNAGTYSNTIAIGYDAIANGSNKIQLGNSNITNVNTSGSITAGSIQNTPIGSLMPNTGSFTTLISTADINVNGIKIGIGAGNNLTNVAFGYNALVSNTTGVGNIAIGESTLSENKDGVDNLALGRQALIKNTSGYNNFAFGVASLSQNTVGTNNFSAGDKSLYSNTSGTDNISFGFYTLASNNVGSKNIGVGSNSLINLSSGDNNIAIGFATGNNITSGSNNTYLGAAANMVGAGTISNSTAIGYGAMVDGSNKIQLGNSSVTNINTNGAITAGSIQNTPIGSITRNSGAFTSLTTTSDIAVNGLKIGLGIGSNNISNLVFGTGTLGSNTSGALNLGIGSNALAANTVGNYNVAIGNAVLYKATGNSNSNVGVGVNVLYYTTEAYGNTSIGTESMVNNSTGSLNSVFGDRAGNSITTGSNNIVIGSNAATSNGYVSNEIVLGNSSNNIIRSQVTSITALSDLRDKKNIQNLTIGLDFVKSLKPRMFNWDKREWYNNNMSDGSKISKELTAGFIAQELDASQNTFNADWLKLVYKSSIDRMEATYGNLLPVIVKAIQEESEIIKSLSLEKDKEILDLKERVKVLEVMMSKILK